MSNPQMLVLIILMLTVSLLLEVALYIRMSARMIDLLELLKLIKQWAYSAKTHHSDAKEALREVVEKVKPGSDEVIAEKVAEKVLDSMARTGSPGSSGPIPKVEVPAPSPGAK